MDARVYAFERFLMEHLTAEQYTKLPTLLGMSDYKFTSRMGGPNRDECRLAEWRPEEVQALAKLLKMEPVELILQHGLGADMVTINQAREMARQSGNQLATVPASL